MKYSIYAVALFAQVLVFGLLGCSTAAGSRAEVHVGDTPEQVRRAVGNPDEIRNASVAGGRQAIWIYKNQQKSRPEATGWRSVTVPEIRDQNREVVQASVSTEVYRTTVKLDLQVSYAEGVVASVELVKI